MGKNKPKKPSAPWDVGADTLIAVLGTDQIGPSFRHFLRENPLRFNHTLAGDALERAKASALKQRAQEFLARNGSLTVEPAKFRDPDTGKQVNPNGVKRRRRRDQIEKLWQNGKLSDRQYDAAKKLRDRYLATQKSAPAIKEIQVDAQIDPGAIEARRIDAFSRFHALAKHVPADATEVISWVVLEDRAITVNVPGERNAGILRRKAQLRAGLSALVDVLEGRKSTAS